jgi:acetyl-CoA carboxylase biotin carboxyl carrier protein
MELDKIITLIHTVSDSALTGFTLEEGNIRLVLEKVPKSMFTAAPQEYQTVIREAVPYVQNMQLAPADSTTRESLKDTDKVQATAIAASPSAANPDSDNRSIQSVKSPLVGTFYTAPSPEEPAFVKVGDMVKKGQILGIIEAMKLMNEIESEYDGVVEAVLIENEQMIEYGQDLFLIR